ncbi:MAG: energy transducer TonB [Bacteroidales bacterium]
MKIKVFSFLVSLLICFGVFAQGSKNIGDDNLIYNVVDIMAQHSTGKAKMMSELGKLTYYPQEAKDNNHQGIVKLRFIVEKDGSISNIEVTQGVSQEIDKIAIEALNKLKGEWIPARLDNKPVRTYFYLALPFYP